MDAKRRPFSILDFLFGVALVGKEFVIQFSKFENGRKNASIIQIVEKYVLLFVPRSDFQKNYTKFQKFENVPCLPLRHIGGVTDSGA